MLPPLCSCMMHLGQNHPALVTSLVPELLSTHPYFEAIEPDVDDPACILTPIFLPVIHKQWFKRLLILPSFFNCNVTDISILVLVFNAAVVCPTILPLYPEHTLRHYIYLRDTLPDVIPKLQVSLMHSSLVSHLIDFFGKEMFSCFFGSWSQWMVLLPWMPVPAPAAIAQCCFSSKLWRDSPKLDSWTNQPQLSWSSSAFGEYITQ